MRTGTYIGNDSRLRRGQTALIMIGLSSKGTIPEGKVMIQANDVSTGLGHGWYEFPEEDWSLMLECPSCDSKDVTSKWLAHDFLYGDVPLACSVPIRTCQTCGEQHLDYIGEEIIDKTIARHLWCVAAEMAAKRAKSFNTSQLLNLMKSENVDIPDMDDWCQQMKCDWPCLFISEIS